MGSSSEGVKSKYPKSYNQINIFEETHWENARRGHNGLHKKTDILQWKPNKKLDPPKETQCGAERNRDISNAATFSISSLDLVKLLTNKKEEKTKYNKGKKRNKARQMDGGEDGPVCWKNSEAT